MGLRLPRHASAEDGPADQAVPLRLLAWNGIIMLVLFVFVCVIIYRVEQTSQLNVMQEIGRNATENTALFLENWIADQIVLVKVIASDKRVVEACRNPSDPAVVEEASEFLYAINSHYPYYENLPLAAKLAGGECFEILQNGRKVTISDGTFFVDTVGGRTLGQCGPHYSYIREIYRGKDYFISEVYPSILRGNPLFVISAPVRDAAGRLLGVAGIAPQMSHFTDTFVNTAKIGETGYMFFLDQRALLIAHPNKDWILNENIATKTGSVSARILAGETEFSEEFLGEDKVYVARRIDLPAGHAAHQWYIVFTQARHEITAPIRRFLQFLIAVGAAFSLVYLCGMGAMGRIILGKTRELSLTNLRLQREIAQRQRVDEELHEANLALRQLASIDGLTQVANRRALDEHLQREWGRLMRQGQSLALIMGDIDFFKQYNDTYGHLQGDECLRRIAETLSGCVHRSTDLVARYGGEEFVVVLPEASAEQATRLAETMRLAVEGCALEHRTSPLGPGVTLSLGVASLIPLPDLSPQRLLEAADQALYLAKHQGRNRCICAPKEPPLPSKTLSATSQA